MSGAPAPIPVPGPGDTDQSPRQDLRLLLPALVAWAVGAASLAWGHPVRWGLLATLALGLVAAGLHHRFGRASGAPGRGWIPGDGPRPWARPVALTALLTLLVAGSSTLADTHRHRGVVDEAVASEAVVEVRLEATTDARLVRSEGRFGPSEVVVLRARATRLDWRGGGAPSSAPVLVIARPGSGWDGITWRTGLTASGRLSPAEPGDDVVAVLRPARPPEQVRPPGGLWQGAEGLREGLRQAVDPVWADARGLVPGLVLGDTSLTPPELTEAMVATGMSHLSAVSGSNVAIVVGAVVWLCSLAGVPRRARPWLAAVALLGFVVLARPEPSVLRAGVMGGVALLGMAATRRAASLPALAASIVLLLVLDPWLARSYGFALSVLATLGLVLFVRPWSVALRRRWPRLPEPVAQGLVIPVAASLTTAPVVAMLQGEVSVVGLLTNLLAAPLVAPSTLGGVGATLVHPFWPAGATAIAWGAAAPAQLIGLTARWGAAVPHGAIPWAADGRGGLALAVLLAGLVLCGPPAVRGVRRQGRPALLGGAAVLVATVLLTTGILPRPVALWLPGGSARAADWRLAACDIGQGDALLLRSGPDRAVLVDTGPPEGDLAGCLTDLGVRVLDAVVITHAHADHSGQLDAVAGKVPVGVVWAAPGEIARARQPGHPAEWREVAEEHGLPVAPLAAGQEVEVGQVHLRAVWPEADGPVQTPDELRNDLSLSLVATVGPEAGQGLRVLLTGDLERRGGSEVQRRTAADGVDVLKVPHHGSATQGRGILERGAPLALVSVGRENDHGHPAPSTVEALERAGSQVVTTHGEGHVLVGLEPGGTDAEAGVRRLWWSR